jgi:hypothetical protein
LRPQPLAQLVAAGERLQLANDRRVAPGGDLGSELVLDRRNPEVQQTGTLSSERQLFREVGERRAAPECERLAEGRCCGCRIGHRLRAAAIDERVEAPGVDLVSFGGEQVATRPTPDPFVTERLAQM